MSLKNVPSLFRIDSEEDLRFAVSQYFVELGFEPNEMSFEDHFRIRLGHSEIIVNKNLTSRDVHGRSDVLLTRNGRPLAIVETKSPDHELTDEDAWQAMSYARLLLEIAPYSILTNGKVTRVYDTLSSDLCCIEDPNDSSWAKHGQRYISISQDLRYETEKALIGVNPGTLHRFCDIQVSDALLDLRGGINEQKKYIPELYVQRQNLDLEFDKWLKSDLPFFAVVGESGYGKTNIMCAMAERMLQDAYVLFYSASRIANSLLEAIRNDFVWEFRREREVAYVVDRFYDICQRSGKNLIVFIDGLDEYNGDLNNLKSELIEISRRIRSRTSIRFCISCKLFDWPRLVIDYGQSYNQFAKSIYPARSEVHRPETPAQPRAEAVGFQVSSFSDNELSAAIVLYKAQYSLRGEFRGDLWKECHNPLMLRFVAEIYANRESELPSRITSCELFHLYWDRRLSYIKNRNSAEQVLVILSTNAIETGARQVLVDDIIVQVHWDQAFEDALDDLLRLNILTVNRDANDYRWISFYFGRFLLFTFTVKAERWPLSSSSMVAARMVDLVNSQVGVEAIEFYVSVVDQGESDVLTELASLNLCVFARVVSELEIDSDLASALPQDGRDEAIVSRMIQYAECYSMLLERYFLQQAPKIVPSFNQSKIGIWTNGHMYQQRTRTEQYPQPLVFVTNEIASAMFHRRIPVQVYEDLQPHGTLFLGLHTFEEKNPNKVAWNELIRQVVQIFRREMLDESGCPYMLQERIWEMLTASPSVWYGNTPTRKRFWSLLGFREIVQLEEADVSDLISRTDHLLDEFTSKLPRDGSFQQLGGTERWYFLHRNDLFLLKYWLLKLSRHNRTLGPLEFRPEELFRYLRGHNLDTAREQLKQLLPRIIDSYKTIYRDNFPDLLGFSRFLNHIDRLAFVEIAKQDHSDFFRVSYVVCPSVDLRESPQVAIPENSSSIATMELQHETLKGRIFSEGTGFGYSTRELKIEDTIVNESEAIVNRTPYPSRTPVSDQVYRLIGNELAVMFPADSLTWADLDMKIYDKDHIIRWVLSELREMST